MFTADTHRQMVALAGWDFSWTGSKSSRPTSDVRAGLFAFLAEYASHTCAFCGEADVVNGYACHIVSSGRTGHDGRMGYIAGNLGWGCADCNEIDRARGAVVPTSSILRPDLIPTAWPERQALINLGRLRKAQAENRREAKRQARG